MIDQGGSSDCLLKDLRRFCTVRGVAGRSPVSVGRSAGAVPLPVAPRCAHPGTPARKPGPGAVSSTQASLSCGYVPLLQDRALAGAGGHAVRNGAANRSGGCCAGQVSMRALRRSSSSAGNSTFSLPAGMSMSMMSPVLQQADLSTGSRLRTDVADAGAAGTPRETTVGDEGDGRSPAPYR